MLLENDETQKQLLREIYNTLMKHLSVQVYDFETMLAERENIAYLDDALFNIFAGYIVRMSSLYRTIDINVVHVKTHSENTLRKECHIIVNYLTTLLVKSRFNKRDEWYEKTIEVIRDTCLTWDNDFRLLISLIILFDYPRPISAYRDLVIPLADSALNILHEHFNHIGGISENDTKRSI